MTTRYAFNNASAYGDTLTFNDGQTNGYENYQNYYEYLKKGYSDSTWDITQWNVTNYLDPTSGIYDSNTTYDSELGANSIVTFSEGATSDEYGYQSLGIYAVSSKTKLATSDDGTSDTVVNLSTDEDANSVAGSDVASSATYNALYGYIYSLHTSGGRLSDINVQSRDVEDSSLLSFSNKLTFSAYEDIEAGSGSGTGVAYSGNSFTVGFTGSKFSLGIFLQVDLWDSRGEGSVEAYYTTLNGSSSSGKILNIADSYGTWNSDVLTTTGQGLHKVTVNLNAALDILITQLAVEDPTDASEYEDLSRWTLGGSYVGLEDGYGTNVSTSSTSNVSATLDVADVTITSDDSTKETYTSAAQKVQTISDNTSASALSAITTVAGTSQSIALDADTVSYTQTVNSYGTDTFSTTLDEKNVINGYGSSLTVKGAAASDYTDTDFGSTTITADKSTPLTVTGAFMDLSVTTDNASSTINATVMEQATLDVMAGTVNLTMAQELFGGIDTSTTVRLTDGSAADFTLNFTGGKKSVVYVSGDDATISNSGDGTQTIVSGTTSTSYVATVNGGGYQQVWTGSQSYVVNASSEANTIANVFETSGYSGDSIFIGGQGGALTVNLNTEFLTSWMYAGSETVNGSTVSGSKDLIVDDGGSSTINGGAEDLWFVSLAASTSGETTITAGSGAQTLFADNENLTIDGGTSTSGSQVIVNSDTSGNDGYTTTVNGGAAAQSIFTGNKTYIINAAKSVSDGSMSVDQQGGATTFNSGDENVTFYGYGGTSTLNLGSGTGSVNIQGDVSKFTKMTLEGFSGATDTLKMIGLTNTSDYSISTANDDTTITFGSGSTLVLDGVSKVDISSLSATAIQISAAA